MQKGFPDFHLPLMKRHYGALYMEVKVNRNSYISPEQRYWITYLKQQGYYADFCYGFDDGKAFIERYLALQYTPFEVRVENVGKQVLQ